VPRVLAPPKLPGLPDPLRRIDVPKDLAAITTIGDEEADSLEPGGVERIWGSAQSLFRQGMHPAITLCVRHEGRVVLDRAIGHAKPGVLADPGTPFCIYSASKAILATLLHLLDERDLIHIDDRVCEYIPEFARHGKHTITVEHVLSHRAGVPSLPREVFDLESLDDRERLVEILCDAEPRHRAGSRLSYHAVSGGFILAEIARRVTGKDVRELLRDEILGPLGFRWGNFGVEPEDVDAVGLAKPTGPPALPPVSTILERALGLPPDEVTRQSNDPRFLTGIVPAANIITTANELSRFFELLRAGGSLDGTQILEPRTIRRAIGERAYRQVDFTLGAPLRHSAGFMLGASLVSLFGPGTELAFGHLGFTNVLAWADPERALSVGLITSGKPVLHHGLPELWALTRRIGLEAPKVSAPSLLFDGVR
jgi:CubicO group peptidase (beta-lactamase class C family)